MKYHALGLMSGTSLDGLDICYTRFEKNNDVWSFKILDAETISYSEFWIEKLRNSIFSTPEELFSLHSKYGFFLGNITQEFLTKNRISNLDVIASHGHTVFHQPKENYTVQIGDGRAIKSICNYPVVYDFRSQDVLLNGNGAPLVPIGDKILFSEFDACINLGGFSNISFENKHKRIAFDICPVNIVLNKLSQKIGFEYDEGGLIAKHGKINLEVLHKLNSLSYYQYQPPKSLGIEWVIKNIYPLLYNLSSEMALATFTEHVAIQISNILTTNKFNSILITGGGAYNNHLIERIKTLSNLNFVLPEKNIIDFKEALIFAFMGVLRLRNENNIISSATGSIKDHCSGLLV